jgi:hypothetical protein
MNHNRLINETVKIKNPNKSEEGFGVVRKYQGKLFAVRMLNFGYDVLVEPERLIVLPSREEAITKLRDRLNSWHKSLPGCADKTCYVCTKQQSELDEAINLLDLLEVL